MRKIAIVLALGLVATQAAAESRISATTALGAMSASAKLKVEVNVPRILYLNVGDVGATVNTVVFNVGLGGSIATLPVADATFGGAIPPGLGAITATDDSGASDGAIPVRLWTNNGTSSLACSGAPLTSGSGATIDMTTITVASTGTIPHPGGNLGCATPSSLGSAGVNNLSDTWTYAFAPSVLPPAGQYTTQLTYTASQP